MVSRALCARSSSRDVLAPLETRGGLPRIQPHSMTINPSHRSAPSSEAAAIVAARRQVMPGP